MRYTFRMALITLTLTACAAPSTQYVTQMPQFPKSEYDALSLDGKNTLTGQVFLKTIGGDVKFGAGEEVTLTPKTSYSEIAYNCYITQTLCSEIDTRARAYAKRTIADGEGKFSIHGIAKGHYFVLSEVTWAVASDRGLSTQGGYMMIPVEIKDNAENNVMVTR